MDGKYYLGENDRKLLQENIKKVNKRPVNAFGRPPVVIDSPYLDANASPDVYAALTIDSLPGIGVADGTGTSPGIDVTGGEVQVYQIDNLNGSLRAVPEHRPFVYNLSTDDIPPDTWVLIHKDKYGSWYTSGSFDSTEDVGPTVGEGICSLSGLNPGDCVRVQTSQNGITTDYYLRYTADRYWTSVDTFEYYPGNSANFEFYFSTGKFHLKLGGIELIDCGDGCFSGGWLTHELGQETGTSSIDTVACNGYAFTVCVTCSCCPIAGWGGPGWYCVGDVETMGTTGECAPQYLFDADKCDVAIEICSGPYDTEVEALAECPSPGPPPTVDGTSCGLSATTFEYLSFTIGGACCPTTHKLRMTNATSCPSRACYWLNRDWASIFSCDEPLEFPAAVNCGGLSGLDPAIRLVPGAVWSLNIAAGGAFGNYESADNSWDGASPLVLTKVTAGGGPCATGDWPATITLNGTTA